MGKYCTNCGNEINTGARFCPKCGAAALDASVNSASAAQPEPVPQPQIPVPPVAMPINQSFRAPKRHGRQSALCIVLSVLLVIQITAVALYGWPGFMVGGIKKTGVGKLDMAHLSPAAAMEASLVRLMERLSDEGVSGGMNLNAAFGIPGDLFSYNSAELGLTIEGEDSSLVYGQRSVTGKNGDAEHSMSMDIDGESMKTGAYFQGDSMILQRGDASLPLIGYKLNSTDAAAMSGMAAMERYLLALRTDTPAQGVDMDWNAALTAVGQLLTDNESKIVTAAESVTAGENSFEAAVCSLTISGYEASQAFSVFIDGWRRDFRCGDMLSMFDAFKEDETPPTLERLASLAAGGGEATLTLKTGVYQNIPVMLEMAYAGVNGECRLGMLFWEQEGNSYSSISLRFPGGDGFSFVDKAAPGGNSTAHSFYGAYNTLLAESLLSSTGSGDGDGFSSQFSYVMTDYTDEDAPEGEKLKSYGNYSHSVIGKVINGSFSGKLLSSEDENKSMAFSGTVNLSEDFGQPMIPEFIEGSGRTASTRRELFAELYAGDEDMVPEEIMRKFEASPALILPLIGNMILFRE